VRVLKIFSSGQKILQTNIGMINGWQMEKCTIFLVLQMTKEVVKAPQSYQCHVISIDDQNWASIQVFCIQNFQFFPIVLTSKRFTKVATIDALKENDA
jgi:hypothetical protein